MDVIVNLKYSFRFNPSNMYSTIYIARDFAETYGFVIKLKQCNSRKNWQCCSQLIYKHIVK